ncbi:phage terminase large subunit [Azospirillum sp. RWY-5-1]|uniref:Phage terminase large subunit n=1 Tax=Azospirillum oleiclasticum TaxID=2735135 RepID=A0ABX2TM12_9PROT|nr:phage terminase large subunit [Azospirillum oleiclasticum]NYZ17055.1 phage terminase large subunit [Azospirillum oleiclasticum]NYZ24501.1 phage terminase large subunit [Azospirillum oleiclasticum]
MARPALPKLSRKEFLATVAETASALRATIEAEVTGLDDGPAAILERRRRALAADGLEFFARTYFPHYVKAPNSRLHDHLYARIPELLAAAEGQTDAIAAPRGEAKSTICSQLTPLWCVARAIKSYILVIMDVNEQAVLMVEAIKAELETNPRLALDFPEIAGRGRVWKEGVIVTRNGVKIHARGGGQRVRGLRHGPHRPDLAILDDLENDENVRTPDQRNKLEKWLNSAVLNVGAADSTLDVLYIGTILHYDSVLARTMRNPLWRATKFQSVIRWPERRDLWDRWEEVLRNDGVPAADVFLAANLALMLAGAEVSWPAVRPFPALMRMRVRIGRSAFASEQQNDPLSEDDAVFGRITYWVQRLDAWVFFGACDPSLGKQNRARDPSAVLVGGYDRERRVLDVVLASIRRRVPDRIIMDVIEAQREFHCIAWGVESVQFQEFFRQILMERSVAAGVPVPAKPVIPHADKALRIESLEPYVSNGLIRLNASQTTLIDQMEHFPLVDHDDGLDALEILWKIATGTRAAAGTSVPPPDGGGHGRAGGPAMRGRGGFLGGMGRMFGGRR